jgi:hypothetical protein
MNLQEAMLAAIDAQRVAFVDARASVRDEYFRGSVETIKQVANAVHWPRHDRRARRYHVNRPSTKVTIHHQVDIAHRPVEQAAVRFPSAIEREWVVQSLQAFFQANPAKSENGPDWFTPATLTLHTH